MDNNKKMKCSSKKHEDIDAIYYCIQCHVYICKKCENFHSDLFENHNIYKLDKNINEIPKENCTEEGHIDKLLYFCKSHNQLCCAKCISKIKGKGNGQHSDCEVCFIEDIKEIKKNKLKENIQHLEEISKNIEQSINELKKLYENIDINKENLKGNIQKIFTKIRSALNEREDLLLSEIDIVFNDIFINENIIKNIQNLPKKIKSSLDKGKQIYDDWKDENKLISFINDCLNVEYNIKNISTVDESIKKINLVKNIEIKFYPELDSINNFLNIIKSFGKIYYRNENIVNLNLNQINIKQGNDIMLISNQNFQTINNLLKSIKILNKIDIISPVNFQNIKYKDIKNYKIIVYDLQDGGYCNINNPEDIKNYLKEGGNIIITHDQWSHYVWKTCPELLGAKLIRQDYAHTKKAKIINNSHPIFTSYYQLDYKNQEIIDIANTHKTDTVYENKEEFMKDILIELEDGKKGEYLLIKEIGKGKLIFWNAGHSYQNTTITDNLTDFEQKLFVNFIYYILS